MISVIGPISGGKTSTAEMIYKKLKEEGVPVIYCKEPLEEFRSFVYDGKTYNPLDKYYKNECSHMSFEILALMKRLDHFKQHLDQAIKLACSLNIGEFVYLITDTSPFDAHVYGMISLPAMELGIYCSLRDYVLTFFSGSFELSILIHMQTSADECIKRMRGRGRKEEDKIDRDYIVAISTAINEYAHYKIVENNYKRIFHFTDEQQNHDYIMSKVFGAMLSLRYE